MEKINGRKLSLIFIFILILLVIALLVGKFTYSYLGPTISDDLETQGEVTASGDTLIFTKGNNLSLSATTDNFTTGGANLSTTTNPKVKLVASTKTNQADATYYVGVYIKNNSYVYTTSGNTPELILTIKDENGNNVTSGVDGLTYVTSGGVSGFDVTGKKGLFNIKMDYPISTTSSSAGTTHTWTFTLTFVNLGTDQSDNENASMNVNVYLQKEKIKETVATVCSNGQTLSSCIIAMDGKDDTLYHHTSSLTNGAGDNSYRFAGASDTVNNYVCFGSTQSPCPADNLYRIIGVFGDKVKLIKYDYATSALLGTDGDYKQAYTAIWFDSSNYKGNNLANIAGYNWNKSGQNTWSLSNLNKTNLNQNFITNIGAEWANKIDMTTWKVGGNKFANIQDQPAKTAYQNEIVNPVTTNSTDNKTEYSAKIGLMYASDYGFAAAPSAWATNLYDYDGNAITNVNWMHMGLVEWTISRDADSSNLVFRVTDTGVVDSYYVDSLALAVRPVLYLKASVLFAGGSGTQSDPIRISD